MVTATAGRSKFTTLCRGIFILLVVLNFYLFVERSVYDCRLQNNVFVSPMKGAASPSKVFMTPRTKRLYCFGDVEVRQCLVASKFIDASILS